jgi:hypothetical protein
MDDLAMSAIQRMFDRIETQHRDWNFNKPISQKAIELNAEWRREMEQSSDGINWKQIAASVGPPQLEIGGEEIESDDLNRLWEERGGEIMAELFGTITDQMLLGRPLTQEEIARRADGIPLPRTEQEFQDQNPSLTLERIGNVIEALQAMVVPFQVWIVDRPAFFHFIRATLEKIETGQDSHVFGYKGLPVNNVRGQEIAESDREELRLISQVPGVWIEMSDGTFNKLEDLE